MIDNILFGLISLSAVLMIFSVYFIFKMKEFEDKRLKNGVSALWVGLIFLTLFLLVKSTEYALRLFDNIDISFYASIAELAGISLTVIFFLVGMILLRDIK